MGPWVIRQFAIVLSEKAQKIPLCDVLCACDFIRWQAIDIRDHPYFFVLKGPGAQMACIQGGL